MGACPDVVSGYNASFRFLGTWTVGVIFQVTLKTLSGEQNTFQGQKLLERHRGSQRDAKSRASLGPGLPGFLAGITPWGSCPTPQGRLILV